MIAMLEIYSMDSCSFCDKAKALLSQNGLPYVVYTLGASFTKESLADRMGVDPSEKITLPQIFLDNNLVGGYDELKACLNAVKMMQYVQERTQ